MHGASIFSKITIWWLTSLIFKGGRQELFVDDLWRLSKDDQSCTLLKTVENLWTDLAQDYLRQKRDQLYYQDNKSKIDETKNFLNSNVDGLKNHSKIKTPSLFFCLVLVFYQNLLLTSLFKFLRDISMLISPIILGLVEIFINISFFGSNL